MIMRMPITIICDESFCQAPYDADVEGGDGDGGRNYDDDDTVHAMKVDVAMGSPWMLRK